MECKIDHQEQKNGYDNISKIYAEATDMMYSQIGINILQMPYLLFTPYHLM